MHTHQLPIAKAPAYTAPRWLQPYRDGTRIGRSQALQAYGEMYCTDGSADTDGAIEELIGSSRTPMIPYASRTGTKRNLDAMRANGWGLLVSAKGVLRTEGFPYMLDNGAWTAFTQGEVFDERAFGKAFDLLGENAKMVVVPDIVAGGLKSLEFSLKWLNRIQGIPGVALLAVQDGMVPDDVRDLLNPGVGIFVGGSTGWKLKTAHSWGLLARRRRCHLHIGRVNSAKRILLCSAAAGAHSVDGTSVSVYEKTCAPLTAAVNYGEAQADFLSPNGLAFDVAPFDCAWPTDLAR
ncbi:hypothetical protein HBO10_24535 [Pseudomonas sp. WS 5503]|jgi:hypothetical protein|uniref:hypothetical protein n=1 Tax=Pseudomonas TaxID=286 RepID=UPI001474A133|nr:MULTISPECIES: hypothetical protein [Pseudomonas]MBF6043285.1 hypothetical protein [Pseudomonas mucoides]NMX82698.1 hypothetical protein [Pseudomonas sp. WS 5503]NNB23730.1 hypothetical protein [Pseudomonas fragi]WHT75721.1 hypothetical protein QMY54_00456 [Pseudomonas rhodesiae]